MESLPSSLLKHPQTENRLAQAQVVAESTRSGKRRRKRQRQQQQQPRGLTLPWQLTKNSRSSSSDFHPDHPDWETYGKLLTGLLLTNALAVSSAWDAQRQCLQNETYRDLVDDDVYADKSASAAADDEQDFACSTMFQHVVLPMGVGTLVLSLVALAMVALSPSTGDFRRLVPRMVVLLVLLLVITGFQTYNVGAIMLQPRQEESSENPYQSLAAVDRYGQVGDNANLYYLTWMTLLISLALLYQVATSCVRAYQRAQQQNRAEGPQDVTTLLRAASWQSNTESKWEWYQHLYKLRLRTGIWTAALIACWVIVASTQYVGSEVLWPVVGTDDKMDWTALSTYLTVCQVITKREEEWRMQELKDKQSGVYMPQSYYESYGDSLPQQFCSRTVAAWFSGVFASILCATAIGLHMAARCCGKKKDEGDEEHVSSPIGSLRPSRFDKRLSLRTELILSFMLSILTGFNAVFCTGVQGPASKVGNLYYASWFAYLLCVRIALGCLEEFYDLNDPENKAASSPARSYQAPTLASQSMDRGVSVVERVKSNEAITEVSSNGAASVVSLDTARDTNAEKMEQLRIGHVRSYFFLSIFSVACTASAYDAASNTDSDDGLSRAQKYMIFAPCYVSLQAIAMTTLCLSKRCYGFVSSFAVGGVLSIVAFGLWLGNLFLTMHSDDSWAVNGIGEIEMANLYYFSWASIFTAGIQMTSYIKDFLGIKMTDYMAAVWVGIIKVCFVILGSSLHIWDTIHDKCGFDEITMGAITFCSRTILAICVALFGMIIGGLVVLVRLFLMTCKSCQCRRLQSHIEMILSLLLLLIFGTAVAMITGIGGPGQSVGDLYYSTWLAFWVSMFVFISCFNEMKRKDEISRSPLVKEMEIVEKIPAA